MGIRGRLFVSHFVLTLIVVVLVGAVTLGGLRRLLLTTAARTLSAQAQQIAQVVDRRWVSLAGEIGPAGSASRASPSGAQALLKLAAQLTEADFAVLDRSGRIVLASERLGRFAGGTFQGRVVERALVEGKVGTATIRDLLGRLSVAAVAPVNGPDGPVGAVALVRPVAEVTQATRRYLVLIFEGLAAGLALSALVSFLLARNLTRPLLTLEEATGRIAAGDFSRRVPVVSSDEFGRVASSFNEMASRLGALQRERQELYASVSHELRTPVTSIKGFAQALLDGVGTAEDRSRYAAIIVEETARLERLVNDLFQLARLEAGQVGFEWRKVDLGALVSAAVEKYRPRAEGAGIALELEGPVEEGRPPGVPASSQGLFVRADPDRLNQVMANLLDNALRFTPSGGRIVVRVVRRPATADQHPAKVVVSVSDTGPGIPEADLGRVFERFYTVDRSRARKTGGTGLGLAIVKEIVTAHGGRVWAERAAEGGARLCLELPTEVQAGTDGRRTERGRA